MRTGYAMGKQSEEEEEEEEEEEGEEEKRSAARRYKYYVFIISIQCQMRQSLTMEGYRSGITSTCTRVYSWLITRASSQLVSAKVHAGS
jgi:hypothetical protein